jgi:Uma2 family endonuclease
MSEYPQGTLTVADLDLMPDDMNRYELIEGELYLYPWPSLAHQRIAGELLMSFATYLDLHPIGIGLLTIGVFFDNINGVIPDLVFFTNERREEIASTDYITGAPDLMVEILSPGADDERRDRIVKKQLYGKFGVNEYWILDPSLRCAEVYRHDGETLRTMGVLGPEDHLTSALLPGYSVKVGALFPE